VKSLYFYRGQWSGIGSGVHASSLVSSWKALDHSVLRVPSGPVGASASPAIRGTASTWAAHVPNTLRELACAGRAVYRRASEEQEIPTDITAFRPDVLIGRCSVYDFSLDTIAERLLTPVVAEVKPS